MADELALDVGRRLTAQGATVTTAESCTGGLIAHRLTNIPGSSAYVLGGVVAYSNAVKHALLGVDEAVLAEHGAVSAPVAEQMARGARQALGATYAVSVTGIAGPGGGTADKPVGLTYIGVAGPDGVTVERHIWAGDREQNKAYSADAALALLLKVMT
ncbi:MAG: CinA family protein [Chloroflexi bacterium]|nr:CinA family protein [Chloroflexota bacterium]